jgi:hypothetical protein
MKDNTILVIGAVGVAALLFLGKKKNTLSSQMFNIPPNVSTQLPQGGSVPESSLPQYGFIQYQGAWYHQSQFQAPAGTDTNSLAWLTTLQNALATGQQLYVLGGGISTSFIKVMKRYISFSGKINPNSTVSKVYGDSKITISSGMNISVIKFITGTNVVKEATVNFYTEKLTGFDAGSVGVSGVYLGGMITGHSEPKRWFIDYSSFEKVIETIERYYDRMGVKYSRKLLGSDVEWKIGSQIKVVLHDDGFDNWCQVYVKGKKVGPMNYSVSELDETLWNMKKVSGIGAVYNYKHAKALTACQDGTYSDADKGACSYHGGAAEVKVQKTGRVKSGKKGTYLGYKDYRDIYKSNWAKDNRHEGYEEGIITL